jgi:methyltransferase family protein
MARPELVGPAGRVVGLDSSQPALQRARSVVAPLGLGNVEVVTGDVNQLDTAAMGGPFDLALTRLFLLYQADPVRTLRRIASPLDTRSTCASSRSGAGGSRHRRGSRPDTAALRSGRATPPA